jgi:hypothetical protein
VWQARCGRHGQCVLSYTLGGLPTALKVIRREFADNPEFRVAGNQGQQRVAGADPLSPCSQRERSHRPERCRPKSARTAQPRIRTTRPVHQRPRRHRLPPLRRCRIRASPCRTGTRLMSRWSPASWCNRSGVGCAPDRSGRCPVALSHADLLHLVLLLQRGRLPAQVLPRVRPRLGPVEQRHEPGTHRSNSASRTPRPPRPVHRQPDLAHSQNAILPQRHTEISPCRTGSHTRRRTAERAPRIAARAFGPHAESVDETGDGRIGCHGSEHARLGPQHGNVGQAPPPSATARPHPAGSCPDHARPAACATATAPPTAPCPGRTYGPSRPTAPTRPA